MMMFAYMPWSATRASIRRPTLDAAFHREVVPCTWDAPSTGPDQIIRIRHAMPTVLYSTCRNVLGQRLAFSRGGSADRRRGWTGNGPGDDLSEGSISELYEIFGAE